VRAYRISLTPLAGWPLFYSGAKKNAPAAVSESKQRKAELWETQSSIAAQHLRT
jgi:hypothetical protein